MTTNDTERCDLTELLVSQCACRLHRGGAITPDLEDYAPDRVRFTFDWFEARWAGHCTSCDTFFPAGAHIGYTTEHELVGRDCCGGGGEDG